MTAATRILAIETSCDETSVAVLAFSPTSVRVLHHETATQIPIHARYGGVVPEVAARTHVAEVIKLLERANVFGRGGFQTRPGRSGMPIKFDAIAVTRGPGLATALRVGIEAARTLAFATGKPLIGVNHLEGHLASAWLPPTNRKKWKFPVLALLVSGGHSELVLMKDWNSHKVLGRTRDDAAGEAFDKTAKLMGLGYPGGPAISKQAQQGNPSAFPLPRPMLKDPSFDFSFSGLKTAVRQTWEALPKSKQSDPQVVADLAASIQQAICDVLVEKTLRAAKKYKPKSISIVGGVSANLHLQTMLAEQVKVSLPGVTMLDAAQGFHTDNAAMIATAAYWHLQKNHTDVWQRLDAKPEWDL